ncbi:hypothetical protein [Flavobacterium columnare]|uniref:hypothetical protein n=1 Tax=Flavobacterium columnare TaxID=996 RepID=UPI000D1A3E42|nr:hypothetical protein [Flavobacterium columnare]PTD14305.1 hypothetical protein C6N29_07580 [Flavobacterium columnare]
MEHKFIRLAGLFFLIVLMLTIYQGCGFFENDNNEYQNTIVGNIKIQKQENSKSINLVFKETDEIFSVVSDDCLSIYYDSINKRIFTECYLTSTSNNYYKIDIIDPMGKYVSRAIKKGKINIDKFKIETKGLPDRSDMRKR